MCFYENYKFACNDWKWGNFKMHCQKEYRTGETCGMKMVYQTIQLAEKCTMCEKIERKLRRREKSLNDYRRWSTEPQKYKFSMEKCLEEIQALDREIAQLKCEKDSRYRTIVNTRRG